MCGGSSYVSEKMCERNNWVYKIYSKVNIKRHSSLAIHTHTHTPAHNLNIILMLSLRVIVWFPLVMKYSQA